MNIFRWVRRHFFTVILLFAGGQSVFSAEIPLSDEIYKYSVVLQDINVVLREFGQNIEVKLEISPKVTGSVRGRLPRLSSKEFLNHLSRSHNLEWYYDGYTLYVTAATEGVTRTFPIDRVTADELTENLRKLSYLDDRYPVRPGSGGKSVIVSGPPRYIALVEQTIASLDRPAQSSPRVAIEPPKKTFIYRGSNMSVVEFDIDNKAN